MEKLHDATDSVCLRLAIVALGLSAVVYAEETMKYPSTRRGDQVDDYHGVKVADPYRWLEDDVRKSKEVADWVEAENKVTFALSASHSRARGHPETPHRTVELREVFRPVQGRRPYFYSKNDGLQNQSVLYTLDSLDGEPRVLLDPNTWSKDGTVALSACRSATTASIWPTASPTPAPTGNLARARHRHGQAARATN